LTHLEVPYEILNIIYINKKWNSEEIRREINFEING
jgi:hypothetical protein